ncbi:hypothetical protein [uncultured Christiangramia sp.]|uniref:hypothetical protein n=1 Tax=uncultured Christiangramia sp. TaxID=503836 RepID=UPI0026318D43|nr:hypothetical protein [uncultured Christiangramia sp.]
MKKSEFRSLPIFSENKHVNVNRENDTISNIVVAQYGKNKNASFFDEKFLNDLVNKGNEQKQGVKSRFGHPNMCANSLGTYVGRYSNFRVEDKKVYADLKLDPISKKTEVEGKGIKMYDYIMDMAESNSDMFGNSIVIKGDEYENEIEGFEGMQTVKVLHSLLASDLVDDPAATDQLFSVEADFGVIMTEFLDHNPQVFEIANDKPEIFMDFISRYEHYHNRKSINKSNMSLLTKMKEAFGASKVETETFDIDLTLATGDMVTVVSENEEPQVGDAVQDAEGKPVEDGNHLLNDGRTVVTEGGNITEVLEADSQEEEEEGNEEQNSNKALEAKFDKFSKDVNASLGLILEQFGKHDSAISNLQKTVKSKSFSAPSKIERKAIKEEGEDSFEAKLAAQREAREKNKKD